MNGKNDMAAVTAAAAYAGIAMAALLGMLLAQGCLTSATAYTKKTNADGSVTESKVRIVGTGDKASQVAAEGLFADGADDALGAGVKTASASQQSTGVKETLEGVGTLLGGLGTFMARTQGVPVPATVTAASSTVPAAAATDLTANPKPEGTASALPGTGIGVVVIGDRETCGYCQAFWARMDAKDLAAAVCGAVIIDADKTDAPDLYKAFAPSDGGDIFPFVRVYEGGVLKGEWTSRSELPPAVYERIKGFTSCGK